MKICIITHTVNQGDGQGRVNYEVVMEVLRRGYRVTLLASHIAPELKQHPKVDWIAIPVARYPTELLRNLIFSSKSANWLQANRDKFDLVKTNGAITSAAADFNVAHFIHGTWLKSRAHTFHAHRNFYGLYQWLYTKLNAHWEKQSFHQANVVIAVSQGAADELQAIGIPAGKVKVIFNGVDIEEFTPSNPQRSRLQLPEAVPLALFTGDIKTPRKNLDTVLQALIQVPSLHLAIAGSRQGSPYPQMAHQLGIQDRIHFLGYRQDIPALMSACDFFIFPSHYETFGLVVLEAMACGLPVITASTVGAHSLVTPDCGYVLVDPNDVEALTKALQALTASPHLRRIMGMAARTIAEKNSWRHMARQYLSLFEDAYFNQANYLRTLKNEQIQC
ncbi:MAG: glycosyltransferase family 4 protein [Cyanothece sp. SIO1E1]|nr:glycosyltransferase family 4 protein [Cyanothece sp. SIO1E1]